MFFYMRNFEHSRRMRQMVLAFAALLGLCFIVIAIMTAGSPMARAATANKALTLSDDDKATLAQVSTYLESITDMQGQFMQIGPDGSLSDGKFYLRRPGRLRFEYTPPTDLLVVADGTWVVVKDGSSAAQRYPIGSTPLGILLRPEIDLRQNVNVLGVDREKGLLRVVIADTSADAPGELTLVFDSPALSLKQWIVTDAQGLRTTVALKSIQSGIRADNALFVVKDEQRPNVGKR